MITRNSAGGSLSAGFITKLQSKDPDVRYRFRFNSVAYNSYVDSMSNYSRSGHLDTGEMIITLMNTAGQWNNFIATEGELTKAGVLDLYFQGDTEYMPIFTGDVVRASHIDSEMKVSLHVRDPISITLDGPLGDAQAPVDYTAVGRNPADLVWDILITHAGLDSTTSQANPDIDYDLWNFWKAYMATQDQQYKAYFFGNSYRSAIREILRLGQSLSWITNEGKIGFVGICAGSVADDTWTREHIIEINPAADVDNIINDQTTRFGWDLFSGTWEGYVSGVDAGSQSDYGEHPITEESAIVWHDTSASATGGQVLVDNIYDGKYVSASIIVPWYGFRTQPGDLIAITDSDYGFSTDLFKVLAIEDLNMDNLTITIDGLLKSW